MSTATIRSGQPRLVGDAVTIAWRNILNLRRNPTVLVFSTIQPIIFVLLFRYVFGGAIQLKGQFSSVPYVDYLMPGVFAQTIVFGGMQTGVGLADDMGRGLIDRFRSLPMARSAVLIGRTSADLVRNVFVIALMVAVGFLVGFRVHTNVLGLLAGVGVMLTFSFALSWIFATVGMSIGNAEATQAASFPLAAPLIFASSAFLSPDSISVGWLRWWARNQPVSQVCDAVRHLVLGGPTTASVVKALLWSIGIVAVFAPIAVMRYRRT
jgi:ABC-2 type transport system permease protein